MKTALQAAPVRHFAIVVDCFTIVDFCQTCIITDLYGKSCAMVVNDILIDMNKKLACNILLYV